MIDLVFPNLLSIDLKDARGLELVSECAQAKMMSLTIAGARERSHIACYSG